MIYPWQQQLWTHFSKHYFSYADDSMNSAIKLQNGDSTSDKFLLKLPHAFLFYGPAGIGKRNFADCVAKKLLCQQAFDFACNQCRSCQLFSSGNHPDFYAITPQEKSKSIKIDQIRDLIAALNQTSSQQGMQIVLIHPAELMNHASHNALLKTLEEPPGQVVIILIVNQWGSIPATVLSRCQKIYFSTPPIKITQPWLQQQLNVQAEQAHQLLQLSRQAPLQALAMGESHYLALRDELLQVLRQLLQTKQLVTKAAQELLKHDLLVILQAVFSIAMDVLRMGMGLGDLWLENQDAVHLLQQMKDSMNLAVLAEWLPQLLLATARVEAGIGINVQLLMENVLLQWQRMGNTAAISRGNR